MRLKVALLADSLALPRPEEATPYEVTYPYLIEAGLRDRLGEDAPILVERGTRARTIQDVWADWTEIVELRRPDVVIVHVGIVDCAPRVFSRGEARLVARVRPAFVRAAILAFVKRYRAPIVRLRRLVYVREDEFRRLAREIAHKAVGDGVRCLVWVNIITPPAAMDMRSPGFRENVRRYNRVIVEEIGGHGGRVVDIDDLIARHGGAEGYLLADGVHLSASGHQLVADVLIKEIESLRPHISANLAVGR